VGGRGWAREVWGRGARCQGVDAVQGLGGNPADTFPNRTKGCYLNDLRYGGGMGEGGGGGLPAQAGGGQEVTRCRVWDILPRAGGRWVDYPCPRWFKPLLGGGWRGVWCQSKGNPAAGRSMWEPCTMFCCFCEAGNQGGDSIPCWGREGGWHSRC